jgi:dephospho-CoA kinase
MPGSGKTEAVKIALQRGIPVVRMGDIVWEEVKSQGLELTATNVGDIATSMRQSYGRDIWARRTLQKIKDDMIVIDGIRNYEEVETFRKELHDVTVVALHAAPDVRYQRMLARQRKDDALLVQHLRERDKRELTWGLGDVISMADVMYINEKDIKSLYEFTNGLLNSLFDCKSAD